MSKGATVETAGDKCKLLLMRRPWACWAAQGRREESRLKSASCEEEEEEKQLCKQDEESHRRELLEGRREAAPGQRGHEEAGALWDGGQAKEAVGWRGGEVSEEILSEANGSWDNQLKSSEPALHRLFFAFLTTPTLWTFFTFSLYLNNSIKYRTNTLDLLVNKSTKKHNRWILQWNTKWMFVCSQKHFRWNKTCSK